MRDPNCVYAGGTVTMSPAGAGLGIEVDAGMLGEPLLTFG